MQNNNPFEQLDANRLADYTLMDDAFMTAVLRDNVAVTETILRTILDMPGLTVIQQETQCHLQNLHGHATVFDVLAEDPSGRLYNIEFQNAPDGASCHRARYHSAIMDSYALPYGSSYEELKESYVIFVTRTDVMGEGLPLYRINRTIQETGKPFKDGSHIIYVNGAYSNDATDLGKLISDLRMPDPDKMHFEAISSAIGKFKKTKEGTEAMSQYWEDVYNTARNEGRDEGRAEGKIEDVIRAMQAFGVDFDTAAKALGVPDDLLEKARQAAEKIAQ